VKRSNCDIIRNNIPAYADGVTTARKKNKSLSEPKFKPGASFDLPVTVAERCKA
jgi:hypothetical protein